jgi:hypothetical protein
MSFDWSKQVFFFFLSFWFLGQMFVKMSNVSCELFVRNQQLLCDFFFHCSPSRFYLNVPGPKDLLFISQIYMIKKIKTDDHLWFDFPCTSLKCCWDCEWTIVCSKRKMNELLWGPCVLSWWIAQGWHWLGGRFDSTQSTHYLLRPWPYLLSKNIRSNLVINWVTQISTYLADIASHSTSLPTSDPRCVSPCLGFKTNKVRCEIPLKRLLFVELTQSDKRFQGKHSLARTNKLLNKSFVHFCRVLTRWSTALAMSTRASFDSTSILFAEKHIWIG